MPYLVNMCPKDIDELKENTPLFIPFGTVEYHGSQLPVGSDILFVDGLMRELDKKARIMVAPTVTCCPNGNIVAGPEKYTIDTSAKLFQEYCYEMIKGYSAAGFRHIILLVYHQAMNIEFLLRAVLMRIEYEQKNELGNGWWTANKNPSTPWIEIERAFLDTTEFSAHGGLPETEAVLSVAPETVHKEYLGDDEAHWNKGAENADRAHGDEVFAKILDKWVQKCPKL